MQLFEAIGKGDIAAVTELLSLPNVDLHKSINFDGRDVDRGYPRTPLMAVVVSYCDEATKCLIARLLINAGARPEALGSDGTSVLHWNNCSAAVMKVLLTAKPPPDLNVRTRSGFTPLHSHVHFLDVEKCRLLVEARAATDEAVQIGPDGLLFTPLMAAVYYGYASNANTQNGTKSSINSQPAVVTASCSVNTSSDCSIKCEGPNVIMTMAFGYRHSVVEC